LSSSAASNTGSAKVDWRRSTVVPQLAKPRFLPAGTTTNLPRVSVKVGFADPHVGLAFEHAQNFLDGVQVRRRAVP